MFFGTWSGVHREFGSEPRGHCRGPPASRRHRTAETSRARRGQRREMSCDRGFAERNRRSLADGTIRHIFRRNSPAHGTRTGKPRPDAPVPGIRAIARPDHWPTIRGCLPQPLSEWVIHASCGKKNFRNFTIARALADHAHVVACGSYLARGGERRHRPAERWRRRRVRSAKGSPMPRHQTGARSLRQPAEPKRYYLCRPPDLSWADRSRMNRRPAVNAMTTRDGPGWCGREDSNFHEVSPTSTSSLRVYHSATTAAPERRQGRRGRAGYSR